MRNHARGRMYSSVRTRCVRCSRQSMIRPYAELPTLVVMHTVHEFSCARSQMQAPHDLRSQFYRVVLEKFSSCLLIDGSPGYFFFFFNDTAPPESSPLPLHAALRI